MKKKSMKQLEEEKENWRLRALELEQKLRDLQEAWKTLHNFLDHTWWGV